MPSNVGSVLALWRFPVKSMGGESLGEAEIAAGGLPGDRAFGVFDAQSGKVVGAKVIAGLLDCHAAYVEPPKAGAPLPPVRITLAGGETALSDSPTVDRVLSAHLGREVRLVQPGPGTEPNAHLPYLEQVGVPPPARGPAYYDLFPVSVITTSTLEAFAAAAPASRFDPRRFRMNVIVTTGTPGFPENAWVEREIALGGQVRLRVAMPDPRCVLTTLAQPDLARDPAILKTMVEENSIQLRDAGPQPCAGVYTVVAGSGSLRTGDEVRV